MSKEGSIVTMQAAKNMRNILGNHVLITNMWVLTKETHSPR